MTGRFFVIIAAIGGLAFLAAIYHLLGLQYASGKAYPPYSSFRTDPLGASALYEAFARIPDRSASRNMLPLMEIESSTDTTLIMAGASLSEDPRYLIESIERFVALGNRLVVAFQPVSTRPPSSSSFEEETGSEPEGDEKEGEDDSEEIEDAQAEAFEHMETVSIAERWNFEFDFVPEAVRYDMDSIHFEARGSGLPPKLPESVSWHSILYFDDPGEMWTPLYQTDLGTVLMERPWGRGSIVLISDSYLLSNEAMQKERATPLLTWLAGANERIVFDERHLGVGPNPGIMSLVHEYGLYGFAAAAIIVVLLYLWRSTTSLVPKQTPVSKFSSTTGAARDTTAGLSGLLKRSVPPADLLKACVDEWQRSGAPGTRRKEEALKRAKALLDAQEELPARERDPVRAYRELATFIEGRTRL